MRLHTPPGHLREYSSAGTAVVLVGDILGGAASWGAHAERLAEQWHVIGVSPLVVAHAALEAAPPEPWSIDAEADALAAALDNLGVRRAHLGGWSMGGAIALSFAMTHPERVLTLALVEPQVRWVLRGLGREAEADADAEHFRDYTGHIGEEELARFLHMVGAVPPGEDPRESRAWRLAWTNRLAIRYAHRVVEHQDDVSRLAALTMPALLVRGDGAGPTDVAITDALVELIPGAGRLLLPGGHTSHLANMDAFLDAYDALAARVG